MKKLLALALCAGIFTTASSQVYIQGGVNFANITKSKAGETQKNNLLTTFNAGIMNRFGLSDVFDIETGLILDGRGARAETYFSNSSDDNYIKSKFNPLYLEIPVNAVIKLPIQDNFGAFLHAGPYVAMGIAGKSKVESKLLGLDIVNKEEKIKFSNDDPTTSEQEGAAYDRLKKFDVGLNVGGGIDIGKLLLKVNYGMGFNKILSTQTDNDKDDLNKFRTLSISLGIPLGR